MYHSKLVSILLIVSFVLNLCTGAAIYPKSLQTQKGSASTTSISALKTKDHSGSQDSWSKYVEFYGSSSAYQGVFTFDASSVNAASVGAYSLDVNFKGDKAADQTWTFEFFDASSNSWVLAGDNSDAMSWEWTSLSFCGTVDFASLVSAGNIQVRMTSSVGDDCDIDYLAITTTDGTSEQSSAPVSATEAPVHTQAPTQAAAATNAPTHQAAATQMPTMAPTQMPTQAAATQKPTKKPTMAATQKPTMAATQKPTMAATQKPTMAATQKPTMAATQKPTMAATQKPTQGAAPPASPGGRMCPTGQVWAPAPGTTWQWQLTGTIDQSVDVQMYDIDLFDNTAATIAQLHAAGRAVICYFSTQYENWRPDASSFTPAVLGAALDDWPGENYVDIRSPALRAIMQARLDLAVSKGCDGVEPDNVDGYANKNGLGLTAADQINFNSFLATEAHKRGLSVGLKNDLDQVSQLVSHFDWVLDEQCNQYGECDSLTPFVTAGKAVFGTEYSGKADTFCPKMVQQKFSWLLKDLDLSAKVTNCCTYAPGGCVKAAHQCVNYNAKRSEPEPALVDEVVAEAALATEYHSAATTTLPVVAVVLVAAIALVF